MVEYIPQNDTTNDNINETDESKILAHIAQRSTPIKDAQNNRLPGDLSRLLSSNKNNNPTIIIHKHKTSEKLNDEVDIHGIKYNRINALYCFSRNITKTRGALVDRGANGGLAGDDVRIISKSLRTVNVQGIDNHQCTNIPIVTAGAVTRSQHGPVIIIMNQYAYIAGGKTIHSSGQMEAFKNDVNDKSIKVSGGTQCITTPDDHAFPLNIKSGLPYMNIRPYTDDEWNTLPHVILTSYDEWNPTILDYSINDDAENDGWCDEILDISTRHNESLFDSTGEYKHRHIVHGIDINNHYLENGILPNESVFYDKHKHDSYITQKSNNADTQINIQPRETIPNEPDYKRIIPHFTG